MNSFQTATLVIAIIGATLGTVNLVWQILWQIKLRRVRLIVSTQWWFSVGFEPPTTGVAIEVTNISPFPVTVTGIGFKLKSGNNMDPLPWAPDFAGRVNLPARIDSHDLITVHFPPNFETQPEFGNVASAYALTASDECFKSCNTLLRNLVSKANAVLH